MEINRTGSSVQPYFNNPISAGKDSAKRVGEFSNTVNSMLSEVPSDNSAEIDVQNMFEQGKAQNARMNSNISTEFSRKMTDEKIAQLIKNYNISDISFDEQDELLASFKKEGVFPAEVIDNAFDIITPSEVTVTEDDWSVSPQNPRNILDMLDSCIKTQANIRNSTKQFDSAGIDVNDFIANKQLLYDTLLRVHQD
ncbi:MAG: hypothetical protein RR540_05960 [Oscillospiraceae bacterium]